MQSQQPNLWACLTITFFFATLAISLRFFSRRLTHIHLWWDDWLALAGYVIAIIWLVMMPIWLSYGLGKRYQDITERPLEHTLLVNRLILFIAELFYAFALFFGKASILMFYWRMFAVTKTYKMIIRVLLGCSVIWIIIRTFIGIWHCVPIQAFWDTNAGGYCAIEDSVFFLGTLTVHIIIDIAILSVPITQIQKLRLPTSQKLAVMVMFMFGIFICIAAAVIIHESINFDAASLDFCWNLSPIVLWATVEVNLVVVSTCLPVLRPAFNYITRGKLSSQSGEGSSGVGFSRGPLSTRKSMKKSGLRRDDDDSSTYQLADSVRGGGSSTGEFDAHASDATMVGHSAFVTAPQQRPGEDNFYEMEGRNGVMVKSETVIKVSKPRPGSDV